MEYINKMEVTVPLTTAWQQVSKLVTTKLAALDYPPLTVYHGIEIIIEGDKNNTGRIYWSRDSLNGNGTPLAAEEQQVFKSGSSANLESLHSLFIKADDTSQLAIIKLHQ